jgi:DNA-binding NtrC family response regulator
MPELHNLVLIDDEPGVLRALGLLLQTMRFTVVPFSLPREALKYITSGNQVDLVVTDLRMPELSGDLLLREIRGYNHELPVIVMSGHATAHDQAKLRQDGASGFIPKPFTPSQFKGIIDLLAEHQTPSPKIPF